MTASRSERQPGIESAPAQSWHAQKERGHPLALWLIGTTALVLGRHVARLFVGLAVAWYLLRAWPVRRNVYAFLHRALPRRPRFGDVMKTWWNFGAVTLDRVFFVTARDGKLDVRVHNGDILDQLQADSRGAILMGAHLGSFVALRALGQRRKGLAIHILQYPEHNAAITRAFARLDPALAERIIPLGTPDVLVRLDQCIRAGGFAALLADRMGPRDTRGVTCEFLGDPVTFPAGGVEAALVLDCPIVLFFGIYRGGKRYELHFERLAPGEYANRSERRQAVERTVGRYVERLEHYARLAPHNWFNFHDYWDDAALRKK